VEKFLLTLKREGTEILATKHRLTVKEAPGFARATWSLPASDWNASLNCSFRSRFAFFLRIFFIDL